MWIFVLIIKKGTPRNECVSKAEELIQQIDQKNEEQIKFNEFLRVSQVDSPSADLTEEFEALDGFILFFFLNCPHITCVNTHKGVLQPEPTSLLFFFGGGE